MMARFRSLQVQLAIRLAAVFLVATAIGVGALVYRAFVVADALSDQELANRADDLAGYVSRSASGAVQFDPPARLQQAYRAPGAADLFAIRTAPGDLIASSDPAFADVARDWPMGAPEAAFFRLEEFGPASQDYYGLTKLVTTPAGTFSVSVARASDADALAHALLFEFISDVAWAIPLFAAAVLAVAVWSIRRGFRPVLRVSEKAAAIMPGAIGERLPTNGLPTELVPLVTAVNKALDRLQQGFEVQRQFTANAAHELRTPLAILTAGLDELDPGPHLEKLKTDAARMNRLVEQLLRVARLDALPIDVSNRVDLKSVASEVVAYLAPWAIAQERTLSLDAPETPVWIAGNAETIADALRNLVENALAHAPSRTEVLVSVLPAGTLVVSDKGAGVPAGDREHIFQRFWRGRRQGGGAGLGLAIVAEIARMHGGHVKVSDAPGGGAMFTLQLRSA